ncbi:unnamed protein product [Lactuca saligna]|uniref:Uncharacterized protein n=1 Tax=Lactuca saligna TaxID=75948 RepID=A0AA36E4F3_LACSI|nr:unnamed protein product [Lactuca saligna]
MAIDLYSDNSGATTTSPRISFSYDLSQSDTVPVEQLFRSFSSASVDFNFCVQENSDNNHASMADELFSDGKILPAQIKPNTDINKRTPPPPRPENQRPRSLPLPPPEDEELNLKQQNSKSFWGFKRSSSCGSGYARSLCPITLLSRSHSTGSSTSSKRSSSSKEGFNQKHQRNIQKPLISQKPPLRKTSYGYGSNSTGTTTSNGVRVSPVLNLGFGSFFSSNKNKNKK